MSSEHNPRPIVEGEQAPVFIEPVPPYSPGRINLRIGTRGRGESQIATLSLTQARLLAFALLREVEEKLERTERLNDEARTTSGRMTD